MPTAAAQPAVAEQPKTEPKPEAARPKTALVPVRSTGGDRDCSDFGSHEEAQRFFLENGGPSSDPHKLDRDHDGLACESS
jgi:micrococcal nuclease